MSDSSDLRRLAAVSAAMSAKMTEAADAEDRGDAEAQERVERELLVMVASLAASLSNQDVGAHLAASIAMGAKSAERDRLERCLQDALVKREQCSVVTRALVDDFLVTKDHGSPEAHALLDHVALVKVVNEKVDAAQADLDAFAGAQPAQFIARDAAPAMSVEDIQRMWDAWQEEESRS